MQTVTMRCIHMCTNPGKDLPVWVDLRDETVQRPEKRRADGEEAKNLHHLSRLF